MSVVGVQACDCLAQWGRDNALDLGVLYRAYTTKLAFEAGHPIVYMKTEVSKNE
jgi:hypothetical protein